MMSRTTVCTLAAALAAILTAAPTSAAVVAYDEDFSAFANQAPVSQDGWSTIIGDGVDVASNRLVGDGTNGGSRKLNAFSLPSNTETVTFSTTQRMRSGIASTYQTLFSVTSAAGTRVIEYGQSTNGWFIRGAGVLKDDNIAGGDEALSTTIHRFYTVVFDYNFVTDTGAITAMWQGGDASFTTILNVTAATLGLTAANDEPAEWTGVAVRLTGTADMVDDILVTYTAIPAPAALPAGLALIGLVALRCRRPA